MNDNRILNNDEPLVVLSYTTTKDRFVPEQLELLVMELARYDWETDSKLASRGLHMLEKTNMSSISITLSHSKISFSKYPNDKYIVYRYKRSNESIVSKIPKSIIDYVLRFESRDNALRYIRRTIF